MISSQTAISAVRFGYGLRPGETAPDDPAGVENALRQATKGAPGFPVEGIEARRQHAIDYFSERSAISKAYEGEARMAEMKKLRQSAAKAFQADQIARIAQAAASPYGFDERLASFWTDHFSVSFRKTDDMRLMTPLYEAEAIRPNMTSTFGALLTEATLHPAMITYLDQFRSVGPHSVRAERNKKLGLNENHGRELLELHTVGAGSGYTQTDVRQASYLLTGLTLDRPDAKTVFDAKRAEPGTFTILGKTYGGDTRQISDVDDFLNDLAVRPETARYISTKLASYFIDEDAPEDVVAAMEETWKRTDGDLAAVYATMLEAPQAFTLAPCNVKQPFDYVVSCLRALNVDGRALTTDDKRGRGVNYTLNTLGQPVWDPPSPEGFEAGRASWVNGHQLAGRIVAARRLINWFADKEQEPQAFAEQALGPLLSDNTRTLVKRAPNRVSAMTLVLASPEFNLR
ncbi:DUF1800 domain-containing protein [Martelella endophytica]|uniref:Uncharacterized protein n=1 Tax=Martelella endophytica TaxID=1486262 RepID=A0A0D5LUD3_MAREN|nr:DUF1800 domain-containing protein [Martelella endophytica]AJY46958.1 hypothetical protein TM49_16735 [Martelella endophytica]